MKINLFILIISFASLAATPLTEQDRTILQRFNPTDTDVLTQESVNELIAESRKRGTDFALAAIKDKGTQNFSFYDAVRLFSYFQTGKKFDNPANRSPIEYVNIYKMLSKKMVPLEKFNPIPQTTGALTLHARPVRIDDFEFVGKITQKPKEGYYPYLKALGIDTSGFQTYTRETLNGDAETLRDIIAGQYPTSYETQLAARTNLARVLWLNANQLGQYSQEAEDLSKYVMEHSAVPVLHDLATANYLQMLYLKSQLLLGQAKQARNRQEMEELSKKLDAVVHANLLPTLHTFTASGPHPILPAEAMDLIYTIYLNSLITYSGPIEEIKSVARTMVKSSENHKKIAVEMIKKAYLSTVNSLSRNRMPPEAKPGAEKFIKAFPNGNIPSE